MPKPPPPPSAEALPESHIAIEIAEKSIRPRRREARAIKPTSPTASAARGRSRRWSAPPRSGGDGHRRTGEKGVTVTLHQPKTDKDPLAVLAVSKRGDVIAAMVEADDPFPPYHDRRAARREGSAAARRGRDKMR